MSSKAASAAFAKPSTSSANASSAAPARRRRESSDDFCATGSLGSVGGSLVGSSVDSKLRAFSLELSTASKGSASATNNATAAVAPPADPPVAAAVAAAPPPAAASVAIPLPASSSATSSPSGRKPFRKRKGSVDFSFSIDDVDSSSTANNVAQLLPQHTSVAAVAAASISSCLLPSSFPSRSRLNSVDSAASSSYRILPSVDALPPMEALPPIDDASSLLLHPPSSPLNNSAAGNNQNSSLHKDRALSFGSSKTEGHGLDHLDSLGVEAAISASRIRKESISERSNRSQETKESNSSHGTLTSQSHRFLLEAFLGDGTESLVLNPSQRERLGSFDAAATMLQRERLGSFDAAAALGASGVFPSVRDASNNNSSSNKDTINFAVPLRDRLGSIGGRRDRLESWGGMSDLSAAGLQDQNSDTLGSGGTATAAALAATIYTSLANDVTAAAGLDGNESVSSFLVNDETIPSKISVNRDRLNSVASMSTEPSALYQQLNAPFINAGTDAEFPSDVQNFVKAAMASVEDQIADLASAVEAATRERDHESEVSSTASPIIGAASDLGSGSGRPRSSSVSSLINSIAVDYDAVAAAVNAAEAAAVAIDLTNLAQNTSSGKASASEAKSSASFANKNRKKRPLPLQKGRLGQTKTSNKKQCADNMKAPPPGTHATPVALLKKSPDMTPSKMDERDMEKIRERARAAAGYVPPSSSGIASVPLPPPKKRAKMFDISTPSAAKNPFAPGSNHKTPIISNTAAAREDGPVPYPAYSRSDNFDSASASKGQSSQKWESMFDCLVKFIDDRKKEETRGMNETEKKEWIWDGNVPTTYKTKDGKALGRWVNNQRSAKSKGTLKEDRETRLVDAGLKWSVLASNSWNEMLEELRQYVAEQVKEGNEWDGNVPTNYRIKVPKEKAKTFVKDDDEDKNLGRWVNRQRSMYQAGKLRKDRQLALEKIGLKWSMLATTSWDSMFDTLRDYVDDKTKCGVDWNGNVPANYKTEDDPPRALGRWINRQRSAYAKKKLKQEYVDKLDRLGLKWSVHERRPSYQCASRPDGVGSFNEASQGTISDTQEEAMACPVPDSETNETTEILGNAKPDSVGSDANTATQGIAEKIGSVAESTLNGSTQNATSATNEESAPKAQAKTPPSTSSLKEADEA